MYAPENVMRFGPNNLVERHDYATHQGLADLVAADDLARWLSDRAVFAVETNGVAFFPLYNFTSSPLRPRPEMRHILAALGLPPWDAAAWFCSGCSTLAWRRPQDVLPTDPKAVITAASA